MDTESEDTVLLTTFSDSMQANIAKEQLEKAGLQARLSDQDKVDTHPRLGSAAGGVKLFVPEHEADAAEKALEDATDASDPLEMDEDQLLDLDDEDQLPNKVLTCPKCGRQDIGFATPFAVYWAVVILTIALPAIPAVSMTVGFAVTGGLVVLGLAMMALRKFPLRCKDCGERGERSHFEDNPRAGASPTTP
jgi:hypothetical protein